MKYMIFENDKKKCLCSEDYNYTFDKNSGMFARWGKTYDDDPNFSPFGPEILDLEHTTICSGPDGVPCKFCYKSNTSKGKNMSFETFKTILDKMPKTLTQIAFGGDATCTSNPDIWKMMNYAREKQIIPNITIANGSLEVVDNLVKLCGAVAVSRYANKNLCYDTVKKLTDKGLKQTNIHILVSEETLPQIWETFDDYLCDERLSKMNAIVLLSLKKKGRGETFHNISQEQFTEIVKVALDKKINIGFDSCGCNLFINAIAELYGKDSKEYKHYFQICEPCESSLFSSFISVDGEYFPCSFADEKVKGIDVVNCVDFVKDVWHNDATKGFRNNLCKNLDCNGCRGCPLYKI